MDRITVGKGITKSETLVLRSGESRAWDITVCSGASLSMVIIALPGEFATNVRE